MIQEIFKHTDFLVVNKPEGLSCHNDENSLIQTYGQDWHLVNRIDKETSGLVVITRRSDLQNSIQLALSQGEKSYFAILRGHLPQTDQKLSWTFPISDKGEGRESPQGKPADQKESKTVYSVVQSHSFFTSVECQLMTGRQHQIRKHSRLAGRPIVGDPRYGNTKDNLRVANMYDFNRMALHSWKLTFTWLGQNIVCEAPIPESFACFFVEQT